MKNPDWPAELERASAFALLHRPGSGAGDLIEVLTGRPGHHEWISEIPLPAAGPLPSAGGRARHDVLAVLPYRQIRERGFDVADDGQALLTISVERQFAVGVPEAMAALPQGPIALGDGGFDLDDDAYEELVRTVVRDEIGTGTGANFVLHRAFEAEIADWSPRTAMSFFRRLLGRDPGAYWTFLVHVDGRTLIGSTPERHVSLDAGTLVMNPISGTYRYPPGGPELPGVLEFLADRKEADELYMVLDEELKMTGRVCGRGARVIGPNLKPMAKVAHTEYLIEGHSDLDVREILRETMFAPTVTGGPLESACRVITRHEPAGRGYYAGALALIGHDELGRPRMDSAITIRTADVDAAGRVRIAVGATLTRGSDPASEAAETRAKAGGLLSALNGECPNAAGGASFSEIAAISEWPAVQAALAARNEPLAGFWFEEPEDRALGAADLLGTRLLVIDNEDTFTAMAQHLLASLGCEVTIRRYDEAIVVTDFDLVIVGPGPGDPTDLRDPKIRRVRGLVAELLDSGTPFLAVCLGHQILSSVLGLDIRRLPVPNQGVQRAIDFLGPQLVGFYNTFAAWSASAVHNGPGAGSVEVVREEATGEVHALLGAGFASVQFHPASVLTPDGVGILARMMRRARAGLPVRSVRSVRSVPQQAAA